jgi:hypothetical protein
MQAKDYIGLIIAVIEKYGGSVPQALIVKETKIPQPTVSRILFGSHEGTPGEDHRLRQGGHGKDEGVSVKGQGHWSLTFLARPLRDYPD